jgi:hypothetical protein
MSAADWILLPKRPALAEVAAYSGYLRVT